MTKCQLLLILGIVFFCIGMAMRAEDKTGEAVFFIILSIPFFIGFWKTVDRE